MTRSIVVRMRRRAPHERVEPYRRRQHGHEGEALRDRLAEWVGSVRHDLADAWPDLPEGIVDRAADVWEPLLAVSDGRGGMARPGTRCRVGLVAEAQERPATLGVRLLADLRDVFTRRGADALPTDVLLEDLQALDEAPWSDLRGKPLDSRGLAKRLGEYQRGDGQRIKSAVIRVGASTPRGYRRADLEDAWSRYLAPLHPRGVSPIPVQENGASVSLPPSGSATSATHPRCRVCQDPLDPVLFAAGERTHPACEAARDPEDPA